MAKPIDQKVHELYKTLSDGDESTLTQMRNVPSLSTEKDRFIAESFSVNPNLTPVIDLTELSAKKWGYIALRDYVKEAEKLPDIVRNAYLPVIEQDIQTSTMLEAATTGNVENFIKINQEIYGEPDPLVLSVCLNYFSDQIEGYAESSNPLLKEACRQAKDLLPSAPQKVKDFWPTKKQFETIKNMFSQFYTEMYEGINLPPEISSEEAIPIIQKILVNLDFDGYEVVPRAPGISTMATDNEKKLIKVPVDQIYERTRFKGLIAHEVGIHVEESITGGQQKLVLLKDGLQGYILAGEGKGLLVEQLVYNKLSDFLDTERFVDIARRYLAIGLSRGVDGNGERDFKDVFAIINAIDRVWELAHDPDHPVKAVVQSINRSWELLSQRTNKGPVGKGSADFKDSVYLPGNIRQWGLLLDHPNTYKYLNLGKYDLTQPEHVHILKQLGLLPKNVAVGKDKK